MKKYYSTSEKVSVFESVELNITIQSLKITCLIPGRFVNYDLPINPTKEELVDELLKRNIKLNQHQQFLVDNYMQDVDFYVIE